MKDYEKIKYLILKEFQPTPQECLLNFRKAQREASETHVQFVSRLSANFQYYCKLREVNTFESLCDLIVADKVFQTLDRELSAHISLKQGDGWFKPTEMAKECDLFFISKNRRLTETYSRDRNFDSPKTESAFNKYREQPKKVDYNLNRNKTVCYVCGSYSHYAKNCTKRFQKFENKSESKISKNETSINIIEAQSIPRSYLVSDLKYDYLFIDGIKLKCLIDSGCELLTVNDKYVSPHKEKLSEITLTSCFKEHKNGFLTEFILFHPKNKNTHFIPGAYVKSLSCDAIIPQSVYNKLFENINICHKSFSTCENEKIKKPKCNDFNALRNQVSDLNSSPQTEVKQIYEDESNQIYDSERKQIYDNECQIYENESNQIYDSECKQIYDNECQIYEIECENEDNSTFLMNLCGYSEMENIDLMHISDLALRAKLHDLIINYVPNKTENTNLKMSIILTDNIPVCLRSRRLANVEKIEVNKQIEKLLRDGVIEESSSDYASPIVLCKKKDGSTRFCIDFRQLNKKTIKDKYPLPIIDEVLDKLQGGKVFTTLDLKNAFFHVDIEENSQKYTAFVTESSQYIFKKCAFGLCNSPATFQRYINHIFRELMKEGIVVIYLDDIIIPSCDEFEGLERLTRVLETASKFGLELNLKKCEFLKRKINFLGHIIENGKIKPSAEKTVAVRNFPQPKNEKEVQRFLGLTGYFRKFIASYATIARPLSDLLRGSVPFRFGLEQQTAFQKLKDILSNEPVLRLYKQGSKLEVHTDACKIGFGAILLQQGEDGKYYPIHYMSRKTSIQEEKYHSYELEMLAVIEALKKFRNYLLGSNFKIYTDCAAFAKTLGKKELTPKIARWALFLQEFDYQIIHRPAVQMQHVDALSRHPIMVLTCNEITPKIISSQENDEYIKTLKKLLQEGRISDYVLKNGVLFKIVDDNDVLVVPEMMQSEIIQNAHSLGHFAIDKTEKLVKRDYYFPNMRKCVERVINNCVKCILVNKKRTKEGLLHPIPKEDVPLSTYHIDFIGPLPSTNKNYNHIFTVIDSFSKFCWLYPVKSTSTLDALQKLKQQQAVFGNPVRIISDRGPAFTSKDFKEYCETEVIEHIMITTGVPRGNGQIERLHGTLIPVLSKLTLDDPTKWYKHVDSVQKTLNSTTSRSTKKSPFELMIGVTMRNKEEKRILELLEDEQINMRLNNLKSVREEARKNILKIQEENRKGFNKKRKEAHIYKTGDLVAIARTQYGGGLKLRPKYFGPYEIVRAKTNDRYDVRKVGDSEGPNLTSTASDHMKPWISF